MSWDIVQSMTLFLHSDPKIKLISNKCAGLAGNYTTLPLRSATVLFSKQFNAMNFKTLNRNFDCLRISNSRLSFALAIEKLYSSLLGQLASWPFLLTMLDPYSICSTALSKIFFCLRNFSLHSSYSWHRWQFHHHVQFQKNNIRILF